MFTLVLVSNFGVASAKEEKKFVSVSHNSLSFWVLFCFRVSFGGGGIFQKIKYLLKKVFELKYKTRQ